MKVRNFTPHPINFVVDGVVKISLPSEGAIRLATKEEVTGSLILNNESIPLISTTYGEVVGLPPKEEETILIVSQMVIAACPDRNDLYSPSGLVRDTNGNIIGCHGLTR